MAAIDVAAENNDVLATSVGACALGNFAGGACAVHLAPDLNCALPLAAEFEFRRGSYDPPAQISR